MAYPVKRRRISNEDEVARPADALVGPITHGVQEVAALSQEVERTPPNIDEVHVRVRRYQASKRSHENQDAHLPHRAMHRRQTAATWPFDSAATTPIPTPTPPALPPIVSVSVVVGGDGFLTPITWTFPATTPVELPTAPTAAVPVTNAAIPSTTEHSSSSTPSSSFSASSSSSASSAAAEVPSASDTPTSTDQSTATPGLPTSIPPEGMIGITPTAASITPTPAPTDVSISASSTNATITDSASLTSSLASLSASGIAASINSTMSDSITASGTSSSGTITASASLSTTSSDLLGLFGVIVTTLPDGRLSTVSASRVRSVTTLPNGSVSTSTGSLVPISTDPSATATDSPSASGTGADSTAFPTGATSGNGNGQGGSAGGSASGDASGSPSSEGQSDSSMPPPQILAGGIVGGVAGIAAILLVAFIFLRWYRRRGSMQRLDNGPSDGNGNRGMAERTGLLPLASAAGLLRGRRNQEEPSGERGFQRVSGRKLPSAFSGGMTGPAGSGPSSPPPVPMPAAFENGNNGHNRNNGGSGGDRSFYRDSTGYYGGVGVESGSQGSSPGELGPAEIQPGPARQATLHPGGPYSASTNPFDTPPGSPRMPMLEARSATPVNLGPSYPERGGTPQSHHSRFTEEV